MRASSAKPRPLRKSAPSEPELDLIQLHSRLKDVVSSLIEYADLTDTFLSSHTPAYSVLEQLTVERSKWENYMIYALGVKEVALRRRFHMPATAFEGDFGKVTEMLANTQTKLTSMLRKSGFDQGSLWETFSELNQRFWDQFFAGKRPHSDENQVKKGLLEEQELRIAQLKDQLKSTEREVQVRDQTIARLQANSTAKPSQSSQLLQRVRLVEHQHSRPPSPSKSQEADPLYFSQKLSGLPGSPTHARLAASGTLDLRSLKAPLERVMQERDQLKTLITRSRSPTKTLETAEAEHFAEKQRLRAVIADLRRQVSELKAAEETPAKGKQPEELLRLEKERSQAFFKALRAREKEHEELSASYQALQEEVEALNSQLSEGKTQITDLQQRDEQAEKMLLKAQSDLDRTSNMLKTLRDDKDLQGMEIKQLKAANGVLEIKNQRYFAKISTLERKLTDKLTELAAIQAKIQELDDFQLDFQSIPALKTHISDLQSANSQLSASLKASHTQLQSTVQTLEDLRTEEEAVREEVEGFQERWGKGMKAVEIRCLAVEKRLKGVEMGVRERGLVEGKLKAENEGLKGKLALLEGEIQQKSTESQHLQAQTQTSDHQKALKLLNSDLNQSKEEAKRLSEALKQADSELKGLKGQISAFEQQKSALKEELKEAKLQLTVQIEQIRKLKGDLSAANPENRKLRIQALENLLETANKDLQLVQQERETARKQLHAHQRSQEDNLKAQEMYLLGEQEKAQEIHRSIQGLEDHVAALERETADLKDNALATAQKVHSLQQEVKASKKQINHLTTEKADLETALKTLSSPSTDTRQQESQGELLQADLGQLRSVLSSLEAVAGVDTTEKLCETLRNWKETVDGLETFLQELGGKLAGERLEALGSYVKGLENEQAYLKIRLKAQKTELEGEIETLRQRLTVTEDQNEGLEQSLGKVKREVQQLRRQEEKAADLAKEREKWSAKLTETEAACAKALQQAEKDTARLQIEVAQAGKEAEQREKENAEIRNSLKAAKEANLAAERREKQLNSEIAALKATQDQSERQFQATISLLSTGKAQLALQVTSLQSDNAALLQERAELAEKLAKAEESRTSLSTRLETALSDLQSSSYAQSALKSDLRQAVETSTALEKELKAAEKDLQSAQQDLGQSQQLLISLQTTSRQLSTEKEALESGVKAMNEGFRVERETLQAQIARIYTDLDTISAEKERIETICAQLEAEKAQLGASRKSLSQKVESTMEHDLQEAKRALLTEKRHKESLETALRAAEEQRNREISTAAEREKTISMLQSQATDLENSEKEALNEVKAVKLELEKASATYNSLGDQLNQTTAENERLQRELADAKAEIQAKAGLQAESESLAEELTATCTSLQEQLRQSAAEQIRLQSALSREIVTSEAEKDQIEGQSADFQRLTSETDTERTRLNAQIEELSSQIAALKAAIIQLKQDLEQSTALQKQATAQIDRQKETILALEAAHTTLGSDLRATHSQLQSLLARISELEGLLETAEIEEEVETVERLELELAASSPNVREIELSTERENALDEESQVPIIYYSPGTSERAKKGDLKRIAAFVSDMVAKMTENMSTFLTKLPPFLTKIALLEGRLGLAYVEMAKLKAKISQSEEDEVSNPEAPTPSLSTELIPCVLVHYEGRVWVLLRSALGEFCWRAQGVETAPVVVTEEAISQIAKLTEDRKSLHFANAELEEKLALATEELLKIRELLESRGFNFQGETLLSVINSISLPRKRHPALSKPSESRSEANSSYKDHSSPSKVAPNARAVTSPLGYSEQLSDSSQSKALSEDESQRVFRTINKLMKDNDELIKELSDSQRQKELYRARLAEVESRRGDPVSGSDMTITVQNLLEILPPM